MIALSTIPVWNSDNLDLNAKSLTFPESVPQALKNYLLFCGIGPPQLVQNQYRRSLYIAWRCIVPVLFLIQSLQLALSTYVRVVVFDEALSLRMIFVFGYIVILPWNWFVLVKDWSNAGCQVALVQEMTQRGFCWHEIQRSIRTWQLLCMLGVSAAIFRDLWAWMGGHHEFQHSHLFSPSGWRIALVVYAVSRPCIIVVGAVGSAIPCMIYLAAKMHRHDLLGYAGFIVKMLEENGPDFDPVPSMRKLEHTLTARLRQASKGWVRCTCLNTLVLFVFVILQIMKSFSKGDENHILLYDMVFSLTFLSVVIVYILYCLAMVADTYEHDVLVALNTPVVLSRVQRHFGQQFLPHLRTLNWGFRCGGTVICPELVGKMVMALLIASIVSCGRVVASNWTSVDR